MAKQIGEDTKVTLDLPKQLVWPRWTAYRLGFYQPVTIALPRLTAWSFLI